MAEPVPLQPAQSQKTTLIEGDRFFEDLRPPQYAVRPILQTGQVVALTAQTNHGKSAFTNLIAIGIVTGISIGLLHFRRGKVLMLFGENVDNARLQLRAALLRYSVPRDLWDHFIIYPYCKPLSIAAREIIRECIERNLGPFVAVIGDTNSAYWTGSEENDNREAQQQAHHWRLFSSNEALGFPVTLINCHPTKTAGRDNLIPRGGSAFISEIDSNLTLWNDSGILQIGYTKLRGPPFETVQVALRDQEVGFSDGTVMNIPVALPLTDEEAVAERKINFDHDSMMIDELERNPDASLAAWAEALGWRMANGKPYKSMVNSVLHRLERNGRVKRVDGRWIVIRKKAR